MLLLGSLLGLLLSPAAPAQKAASSEVPIRILHADRLPLDRGQSQMVLEGHVRVARGETKLSGESMKWSKDVNTLEIWGGVRIVDKDFRLASEHLLYDLAEDAVTAWGNPRLEQVSPGGKGESIELTSVQLRLFPKEGRVEAIEDVILEQRVSDGTKTRVEMRVACRVAEVLARGRRNVFKGDVKVETPDIGAEAGRMLYEQESRRVYLLDGARVWNYDSNGSKLDELRGDKVIYLLDEARTIALGGVRASIHPEGSPGQRTLLRSRRSASK